MAVRLVTPLGSGSALHAEQGGTGLNVQELPPNQVLVVAADSKSITTAAFTPAGAGAVFAIATKIANYNIALTDCTILGDATAGNITQTLPDATTCAGQFFTVKKIDATANTVTVAKTGGQTIDGMASYIINAQYAAMTVQSNGVNWSLINEKA